MKITDIRVRKCEARLEAPMRSRACQGFKEEAFSGTDRQSLYVIELFTDSSHVGLSLLPLESDLAGELLTGPIPLYLLGEDPNRIPDLLARMRRYRYHLREEDQFLWHCVVNHVEFALWDLRAKLYEVPLYRLLGGRNNRVRVYAGGETLCWGPLEDLVEEAAQLLERGFDGFKVQIGHGLSEDTEIIRELRSAVGGGVWITADANQAYDMENALELMNVLAEEDIAWFEDPVPYDIVHYQILRDRDQTMIAAGEEFRTLGDAMEAVHRRTVDVLQCDAGVYSVSDLLAIKHMALDADIRLTPHSQNNAIGLVMAAHLQKSTTPAAQEFETFNNPLVHSIFNEPFTIDHGDLLLPDKPGHGFTLNEETVGKYLAADLSRTPTGA